MITAKYSRVTCWLMRSGSGPQGAFGWFWLRRVRRTPYNVAVWPQPWPTPDEITPVKV